MFAGGTQASSNYTPTGATLGCVTSGEFMNVSRQVSPGGSCVPIITSTSPTHGHGLQLQAAWGHHPGHASFISSSPAHR